MSIINYIKQFNLKRRNHIIPGQYKNSKPNILLITSDQQRKDSLGINTPFPRTRYPDPPEKGAFLMDRIRKP